MCVLLRFRRQTHVTPKSYLSFLELYRILYHEKHSLVAELAQRMTTGLEKLEEASTSVDFLSKELVVKEKDLIVANVKADKVTIMNSSDCIAIHTYEEIKVDWSHIH